jgi:cytosine/adenosine deaminase-related metal-dependent hydrolase
MQQEELLGTLEVGKKADLIVIDTLRPYLVPAGRIVSAVIHSGHPTDIESVMIDGQFVIRKGKVLTMDEDAVLKEADAVSRRIWGKVLEAGPVKVPRLPRPR